MLCTFCDGLSISCLMELAEVEFRPDTFPQTAFYQHHASIEDLVQSAEDGCELCQLILACSRLTPDNRSSPELTVFECCRDVVMKSTDVKISINTSALYSSDAPELLRLLDFILVQFGPLEPSSEDLEEPDGYYYLEPMAMEITVPRGSPVYLEKYGVHVGRYEVDSDLRSECNFDLARSWLATCFETHECCPTRGPVQLPTRLVDIGTEADWSNLRIIQTPQGEKGEYAALSHCWGGPVKPTLTKKNLPEFLNSVPFSDLPKNFRDAIVITRGLGLRYIWIDSLCIIQDSAEDWGVEAGRMSALYLNAAITICAGASAASWVGIFNQPQRNDATAGNGRAAGASEAEGGFDLRIFPKSSDDNSTVRIGPHFPAMFPGENLSDEMKANYARFSRNIQQEVVEDFEALEALGALGLRAWALQEKVLAPRRLVYGKKQLYWQCTAGCKCADGVPEGRRTPWHPFTSLMHYLHDPGFRIKATTVKSSNENNNELKKDYYRMVFEFSTRSLTYASDKLPAFSGIARKIHPLFGGAYLAGIWSADIHIGLSWHCPDPDRSNLEQYRAPSWTWASTDRRTDFMGIESGSLDAGFCRCPEAPRLKLLSYRIHHREPSNPYGQVDGGHIVVRGITRRVFRSRQDRWPYPIEGPEIDVWTWWDVRMLTYCRLYKESVDGLDALLLLLDKDSYVDSELREPEHEYMLLFVYSDTGHVCGRVPQSGRFEMPGTAPMAQHAEEDAAPLQEEGTFGQDIRSSTTSFFHEEQPAWSPRDSHSTLEDGDRNGTPSPPSPPRSLNEAFWLEPVESDEGESIVVIADGGVDRNAQLETSARQDVVDDSDEGGNNEYDDDCHGNDEDEVNDERGNEEDDPNDEHGKTEDGDDDDNGNDGEEMAEQEYTRYQCLILRLDTEGGSGAYTRVGLATIRPPSMGFFNDWTMETVTLV